VKKTVSGVTTSYFYSGSVVISEQQGFTGEANNDTRRQNLGTIHSHYNIRE